MSRRSPRYIPEDRWISNYIDGVESIIGYAHFEAPYGRKGYWQHHDFSHTKLKRCKCCRIIIKGNNAAHWNDLGHEEVQPYRTLLYEWVWLFSVKLYSSDYLCFSCANKFRALERYLQECYGVVKTLEKEIARGRQTHGERHAGLAKADAFKSG